MQKSQPDVLGLLKFKPSVLVPLTRSWLQTGWSSFCGRAPEPNVQANGNSQAELHVSIVSLDA